MAALQAVAMEWAIFVTAMLVALTLAGSLEDPHWTPLRGVTYIRYARGIVDNASLTLRVHASAECGSVCRSKLICPAFSLRNLLESVDGVNASKPGTWNEMECRIVLGADYSWTPDPSAELFAESIGDVRGYTFRRDGKFYKVFSGRLLNVTESKAACIDEEGGSFAVPYPRFRYDVITTIPDLSNASVSYFVGITGAGKGRWVTDDGSAFFNSSSDPNQVWAAGQPDGNTNVATLKSFDGTLPHKLDDGFPSIRRLCYVCRRGSAYRRLTPSSGKFYRLYSEKTDCHSAAATCASDGGSLASFVGDPDFAVMERFRVPLDNLPAAQVGTRYGLWIAGTDEGTEGVWRFPDGTMLNVSLRSSDPLQKRFFKYNAPNNSNPDENCLALGPEGAIDVPCNRTLRFICEILAP